MPANRHNPKMSRRASDFATLADVTQIVAAALERYDQRPWWKKLLRQVRGLEEPRKVPGIKY